MRPPVRLLQTYLNKKRRATNLRKRGYSYLELSQTLKISKSTAYYWTKRVNLSISAQAKIEKKLKEAFGKGLAAYNKIYGKIRSQKAAEIRNAIEEKSSKEIDSLSLNDLKLIGSALYWAEGNTKNRNRLQFSNCNPDMIRIAMRFFREVCNVTDQKFKAIIHTYPQIDYRKALNFWYQITKIPKNNFYPPQIQISSASKRKRPSNTLPYGTIHITILDTKLTCTVKGWIRGMVKNI